MICNLMHYSVRYCSKMMSFYSVSLEGVICIDG